MIAETIAQVLKKIGHTWKMVNEPGWVTSGPKFYTPDEDDVQRVLDSAAKRLYDEPVGARLTTGGLIIEKAEDGYDAYVFVGNYEGDSE